MARSGGGIELYQEGAYGLLYAPGDANDLAAKIASLLGNPAEAAARVRRAYEFASSTFTREGYGEVVFRKVADLVGAPNPKPHALWLVEQI